MNVQYNSVLRQSKAIRADFARLSPAADRPAVSAAEIGNVAAALAGFGKSIDEYAQLARQEPVARKQEEAQDRLRRFRDDLSGFRAELDAVKRARDAAAQAADRAELLGRRPYVTATPENPYAGVRSVAASVGSVGPGQPASTLGFGSGDAAREDHALREQSFFASSHSALDDYIARGQQVLGDLGRQREILKGTQRRLYSVANTLGVSGDTIRMVERRVREDKWIFGVGAVVFLAFCWLCLRYLR